MSGSGSVSVFGIRIRIQQSPEYGSNTDPDPQHCFSVQLKSTSSVIITVTFRSSYDRPSCLFVTVCQGIDSGAHQPAGILVAGADSLGAFDEVVFVGHAARQQDPAVHFGRIQGPVGYPNKGHLGKEETSLSGNAGVYISQFIFPPGRGRIYNARQGLG